MHMQICGCFPQRIGVVTEKDGKNGFGGGKEKRLICTQENGKIFEEWIEFHKVVIKRERRGK